ncbi:MAG: hypothetical protein FJ213_11620 [Ignavibacteria bacterium]|nr:hypothetical protein [Ignavibacteria bacterium]
MRIILFSLIALMTFNINISYCQLKWKLNLETGNYSTSNTILKEKNDLSIRSEGEVKYNYDAQSSKAFIQIQARPEIFGILNKLYTFKLKAFGGFYKSNENYDWGINFSAQNHFYSGETITADFATYFIQTNLSYPVSSVGLLVPNIGYAYQNINFNGRRSIDVYFADLKFEQLFNQYFRIGYGIYGERFILVNKQNFLNLSEENSNSGFRAGPQLSINYIRDFFLSGEARFLFHESKVTQYPSYETLFRFIGGKILTEDLTLMLLVDFYARKFSNENSQSKSSNLLYTPINLENRFYLKLSYDVDENWEIFSKAGYSKEYLYDRDLSLSGWSFSIGLSLTN